MSKTKSVTKKGADKPVDKALSKVKGAGVTKASQSPKAKSKQVARELASKETSKRKKKEPTPSSSSESDSDEEMESSSSSSESEEKPAKKEVKKVSKKAESSSESESGSDSDEEMDDASSSESESEDEKPVKKDAKKESKKAESSSESESDSDEEEEAPKKAVKASSDSEDSESESESEDEAPAKAKKAEKETSEESEDSDESEDSEGSDSDSSESESEKPSKKRKAEEEPAAAPKKSKKTDEDANGASANLFVGNLSWNVDEEWLRQEFETFGELSGVRIVTDRESGRSRGFGYVEYASAADAAKAFAAKKDTEIDGRKINLDYASGRPANNDNNNQDRAQARARNFGDQASPESDTLFVGNIPFSANEDSVSELFGQSGTIVGIRLPTDPESGRPKGFGYVQFASVDEARQAFNDLNGAELNGRAVRLDFSTPRPPRDDNAPRGGRGGFGGRGGRGGRGGPRGGGGRGGRGGFGGRGGGAPNKARGGIPEYKGTKVTF
ncbi:hypothetical protein CNMCM5793_005934 [Aspergillus hiratsukae]|uniref:RRM domain-containing protein n=1 Tax=Aspergillus hiratsukae TaxID=1194566 RepID=A0A8H6QF30_9EURO|nr:hypothetical protein CNMCM5793_005934 [Aspergillus hiratsukae]KAF7172621.1 hypothetical protein CNMCM6106_006773 [Aspergillus hiratsukae]